MPCRDQAFDTVREELPGAPSSARVARRLVQRVLREWDLLGLEDQAVILANELATNALLHARGALCLELTRCAGAVRISLFDTSPARPARRRAGPFAGSGRGLTMVADHADRWGVEGAAAPWVKVVWFELDL